MPFQAMTPQIACALLAEVGVPVAASAVRVEPREERWLVRLPGQRVAWIAASEGGLARLRIERRVLRLLAARCGFPVPRVLLESTSGDVDAELIARAVAVIDAYENVEVLDRDRALVHTDLGFHNLGIDLDARVVHGIFDYEGAAWADPHHDFRYLVFDLDRHELLEAALAVYEPRTGRRIDRDRVLLYNAACAVTFLAYRAGTNPEDRSCGRTLAEDLKWSEHAIARALGE